MRYADRKDAGEQLAAELLGRSFERPLVLALPRGGVPVGYEVARALECPLDTLVVRKVGAPLNPEWAVGAVAPKDITLIDNDAIEFASISRASVDGVVASERKELERRERTYRSGTFSAGYIPRTVILVDDGIATGLSARAALLAARLKYPKARLILAAPVCLGGADRALQDTADEIVCLERSAATAVGASYGDFSQLEDETVVQILAGEPPPASEGV
jgi:putative phosphoribosyl transferase